MGNKAISNRVNKILALQAMIQDLNDEIDAIKDEIKNDMTIKGVDEINDGSHVIKYKDVTSTRLDSKALKDALPDVYSLYARPTTSKRFTIA